MSIPENATVFASWSDPKDIQAARDRGEVVVVLPKWNVVLAEDGVPAIVPLSPQESPLQTKPREK